MNNILLLQLRTLTCIISRATKHRDSKNNLYKNNANPTPSFRLTMTNHQAIDGFIGKLYRAASEINPTHFRKWALTELKELILFDAALWSNGQEENRSFHNHMLINVDETILSNLKKTMAVNPIVDAVINNLGLPVDMADVVDDETFYSSYVYEFCFKPLNIERILSSIHTDGRSGLFTLLSLYRFDREHAFSEKDKYVQERVLFHLLNAASHNLFLHLKLAQANSTQGSCWAICDKQGYFHEIQPATLDLLQQYYPEHNLSRAPFSLNEHKQALDTGLSLTLRQLDDLYSLEIWPTGPFDQLTEREKTIANAVSQGKTFKQIAKDLNLSPSTVANHLYRVYQKLNIQSRNQLAEMLNG